MDSATKVIDAMAEVLRGPPALAWKPRSPRTRRAARAASAPARQNHARRRPHPVQYQLIGQLAESGQIHPRGWGCPGWLRTRWRAARRAAGQPSRCGRTAPRPLEATWWPALLKCDPAWSLAEPEPIRRLGSARLSIDHHPSPDLPDGRSRHHAAAV